MSNYSQITAQIEKLQKEAEAARKREIAQTIANIKRAIQLFGLTLEDLGLSPSTKRRGRKPGKKAATGAKRRGRPAKKAAGKKSARRASTSGAKKSGVDKRSVVAPKYRDAATGATWTGRGKQPKWLAAALKSGKKLDDFKI